MSESPHNPNIPRELIDKPALELVWSGLKISISAGQMTRRQAYEMITSWEADEESDARRERFEKDLDELTSVD